MITKAQRRAHLEAVILSARLRNWPVDSEWARAALDTRNRIGLRVDALRASLAVETPGGNVDENLMLMWAHWMANQK